MDNVGQQGNTQCVTYLVGVNAPELMYTSYVNGTMVCMTYLCKDIRYYNGNSFIML